MHRLDASDGGLQQRLMPALGRLLAGGDPDECVKTLHLISDFIAASRPVEQRKPAVPLRAGGELVGALNEVALNQLMPRLRALSTTNGSH
jgi:hypothetical protein